MRGFAVEKLSKVGREASEPVSHDSFQATRILVVEDQRHLSRFLQYVLEGAGYEVRAAYDGEQALAAVESFQPAAMLLDPMLPGVSGLEVLKRLRSQRKNRDLVIVMLATSTDISLCAGMPPAGANSYCSRPFAPGTLLEKLTELSVPPRQARLELSSVPERG